MDSEFNIEVVMKSAKHQQNETKRLAALKAYNILDSKSSQNFDELTILAASICEAPIALISFVDKDRQWFKSKFGLSSLETPRDISFCAHAILQDQVLVIEDAMNDERFRTNQLVTGSPFIRFYAGAPLIDPEGLRLGTLCVIDTIPRKISPNQIQSLQILAKQVVYQLEVAKKNSELIHTLTELNDHRSMYDFLVNQIDEVVFKTNRKGQLQFLNKAWSEITGYAVEDCLGNSFLNYVHSDDKLKTIQKLRAIFDNNLTNSRIEIKFLSKDKKVKWGDISLRLSKNMDGVVTGCIGTLSETTHRKRYELELIKAREDAIASEQVKAAFLTNMSHEIRTPMNAIIGMANMLIDSQIESREYEYAKTIKHSADALMELINDILDFSKIETGKMELENISFNITPLIEQTVEMFQQAAKKNNTKLTLVSDKSIPKIVTGDPFRLRQIFINLISNAIKFTSNGDVTVRVQSSAQNPFELNFNVEDSGIGISPDSLEKIFHAFSQGDNSMTRKYGGTGLGLSITKQIVQLMNGSITVKSELGKGSMFNVTVNLNEPKLDESETLRLSESPKNKINKIQTTKSVRILIAEDNLINQKVYLGLLHDSKYHVDIVDNGKIAVASARKSKYDLILMDCQMPEMDGYEATIKIRKNEKSSGVRTPIIAVTANTMANEKERCLSVGMDDHISKPISGSRLIELIQKWLPTSQPKLLDDQILKELEQMGQESQSNLLADVIAIFLKEGPAKIVSIRKLISENNLEMAGKQAHHFKSSCNGVGALTLANLCQEIEINCKNGKSDPLNGLMMRLENDLNLVNSELNQIIATTTAA